MAETTPIRLPAAAKKLNVGTSTIVEHLQKKGFDVENRPTTKLSPEMYQELMKEFSGEMHLKEESDQITLGNKEREDIELDSKKAVSSGSSKKKEEDNTIIIQSNAGALDKEDVVETKKVEVNKPKIIGKIDLDADKKKKEEAKKAAEAAEAKKKEDDEAAAKKAKEDEDKAAEEAKKKADKEKEEAKKAEEPEMIKTKKVELEGPKILGKIDLPTKPERKKEDKKSDDKGGNKRRRRRITKERIDPSKGGDKGKGKRRRDDDVPAVSEKEIEEKIKATMAKISGQSSKSSRSKHRRSKRQEIQEAEEQKQSLENDKLLKLTEFVTVSELANMMSVSPTEVIKTCMDLGVIVSINQRLDAEIIELVTAEFEYEVEFISTQEEDLFGEEEEDDPKDLVEAAPIVTIMGHVDHGKTSLLDYIRKANVVSGEAGGITQHIGAYEVEMDDGKSITFLDTPGHEAFTAMRARGAKLTDVAVIVIAADDDIMPQTKEAISHAQSAGVPMIFAINKVDKENARPDNIKQQLANMNLLIEEWGGKYQSQDLSAKTGDGVPELLEKILLEAELLELKANPDKGAIGSVIEASLDRGRGYVATLLVQGGTLKIGDMVVAGSYYGKIKAMFDHVGKKMKSAGPAQPVQVLGLNGAPTAGEKFKMFESEQDAKAVAVRRSQIDREQGLRAQKHITLDEIGRRLALGNFQELNVIVKGDVDGSIEALSDSLLKLSTEEIQVNILHKAVGQIAESDVLLASASDAIIIGFQVRPSLQARKLAEAENIEIRLYSVIYDAIDEIKSAMEGMLEPKIEEKVTANLEVRDTFKITKVGTIAGCYVQDGKISRNAKVRLIRDGIVIYTGEINNLKRFKEDAKEVAKGNECGLSIENFNDIKVGDQIEAYEEVSIQRTL